MCQALPAVLPGHPAAPGQTVKPCDFHTCECSSNVNPTGLGLVLICRLSCTGSQVTHSHTARAGCHLHEGSTPSILALCLTGLTGAGWDICLRQGLQQAQAPHLPAICQQPGLYCPRQPACTHAGLLSNHNAVLSDTLQAIYMYSMCCHQAGAWPDRRIWYKIGALH